MASLRRLGAVGIALGLCMGAAGTVPASASVLDTVDGGLLGGLLSSLLSGEGGILGHEGGVLAGDDTLGDVVGGFAEEGEGLGGALDVVGAVGDVVADPNIGGEDSFGSPQVGGGLLGGLPLGGLLGGLLGGGTGLLGGVF